MELRSPALQADSLLPEPPGKPTLPKKEVYFTKDKTVSNQKKKKKGKSHRRENLEVSFERFYRVTKKRD